MMQFIHKTKKIKQISIFTQFGHKRFNLEVESSECVTGQTVTLFYSFHDEMNPEKRTYWLQAITKKVEIFPQKKFSSCIYILKKTKWTINENLKRKNFIL